MKLACASSACANALDRGDLTQLEFLDLAARELACDGVVLDVRHFPRTDDDYLAQVKKMAADLGLCIAALLDHRFFAGDEAAMRSAVQRALALGAPLLAGALASETQSSWSQQLEALGCASGLAKAHNVTLAVRNAPESFAASAHDCKRVSKETDSAWLRFGLEPDAFDAASDTSFLESKTVLMWAQLDAHVEALFARFPTFRGYLTLDKTSGDASIADMQRAMHTWRIARAREELNRK